MTLDFSKTASNCALVHAVRDILNPPIHWFVAPGPRDFGRPRLRWHILTDQGTWEPVTAWRVKLIVSEAVSTLPDIPYWYRTRRKLQTTTGAQTILEVLREACELGAIPGPGAIGDQNCLCFRDTCRYPSPS